MRKSSIPPVKSRYLLVPASNGHLPSAAGRSWLAKHRKDSAGLSEGSALPSQLNTLQKRQRSTSVCASQLKAEEMKAIANLSYQHALNGGRKASAHGVMPPLTRLRIQQCFRNAK